MCINLHNMYFYCFFHLSIYLTSTISHLLITIIYVFIYIYTHIFITYMYIFINISTYLSYIYSSSIYSFIYHLPIFYLFIINYLSSSHHQLFICLSSICPSIIINYLPIYLCIYHLSLIGLWAQLWFCFWRQNDFHCLFSWLPDHFTKSLWLETTVIIYLAIICNVDEFCRAGSTCYLFCKFLSWPFPWADKPILYFDCSLWEGYWSESWLSSQWISSTLCASQCHGGWVPLSNVPEKVSLPFTHMLTK